MEVRIGKAGGSDGLDKAVHRMSRCDEPQTSLNGRGQRNIQGADMQFTVPVSVGEKLFRTVSEPVCDTDAVRALIPLCAKKELNQALVMAAEMGHVAAVHELIPVSEPKAHGSSALRAAAHNGHLGVLCELIPVSDPQAYESSALCGAAMRGNLDAVRVLIPVSNARASQALLRATQSGHIATVRELIPVSDPMAEESRALRSAARLGYSDLVRELAPVNDAARVFQSELEVFLKTVRQEGIEAAGNLPSLLAANALTPYVDENLLEQAARDLPSDLLKFVPHLAAWHAAKQLGVATPLAATPPRRRCSL
ncbi:MAG: hypothetical protein JNN30_05335 [Rhodanobacteraceae bacterium]|nr:hypothetical protein [Rhodanobacteraceae bacterium]